MGKSFEAMGSSRQATPRLIASMSGQLVIPGRVALQPMPLVLHQPRRLANEGCHLNSKNHLTASVTIPNCLTLGVQSIGAAEKGRHTVTKRHRFSPVFMRVVTWL